MQRNHVGNLRFREEISAFSVTPLGVLAFFNPPKVMDCPSLRDNTCLESVNRFDSATSYLTASQKVGGQYLNQKSKFPRNLGEGGLEIRFGFPVAPCAKYIIPDLNISHHFFRGPFRA